MDILALPADIVKTTTDFAWPVPRMATNQSYIGNGD